MANQRVGRVADINQYRYCHRAKASDHMPIIGPVAKATPFLSQFSKLKKSRQNLPGDFAEYHTGLYCLCGFGSHGFTSIPLSVEILMNQMFSEPLPVSNSVLKQVSAARFLIKKLVHG